MSSAHNLPLAIRRCLENGFFEVPDPGDAGTISWSNQGFALCRLVSAAAETRVLDTASSFPVNTVLAVYLKTDGGNVTITGSTSTPVVLANAGDFVIFVVSDNDGTYEWRLLSSSGGSVQVPLVLLSGAGAAPAASGLLAGGGTSANPNVTAAASANFIEFRNKSSGTGAQRSFYTRFEAAGAGNYEAVRGLTVCSTEVANATGLSGGVSVSDTGYVTGSSAAVAGTTVVANAAVPAGGTYYAGAFTLNGAGSSSTLAAVTKYAILQIGATGNSTFVTSVKNAIAFDGAAAAGGGDMISPGTSIGSVTGSIRILVNGDVRYLPFYSHEGHA